MEAFEALNGANPMKYSKIAAWVFVQSVQSP